MSGFTFLTREQLFDWDDELDIMKKRGRKSSYNGLFSCNGMSFRLSCR